MLADEAALIAGGTGSLGNAAIRRLLASDIAQSRILSRDGTKQEDMHLALPALIDLLRRQELVHAGLGRLAADTAA